MARRSIRWAGVFILAVVFVCGWIAGAAWARTHRPVITWECSGERLVGTLFTDDVALAPPGQLVLAWTVENRKKLISRDLFEICAEVPTN